MLFSSWSVRAIGDDLLAVAGAVAAGCHLHHDQL